MPSKIICNSCARSGGGALDGGDFLFFPSFVPAHPLFGPSVAQNPLSPPRSPSAQSLLSLVPVLPQPLLSPSPKHSADHHRRPTNNMPRRRSAFLPSLPSISPRLDTNLSLPCRPTSASVHPASVTEMELEVPLLLDANATAAHSSAGKKDSKDGGDPIAATQSGERKAEHMQLAALNSKNSKNFDRFQGKNPEKVPVQVRPLHADSLADLAEVFARDQRELRVTAEMFADKARAFANNPEDPVAADAFIQVTRLLSDAAVSTPQPRDVGHSSSCSRGCISAPSSCSATSMAPPQHLQEQ